MMGRKSAADYLGPVHNSHLTAIRRCKKKFKYAYIDGIQPKQPGLPLARGSWIHYCLEAQFLKWGIEDGTLLKTPKTTHVDGIGDIKIIPGETKSSLSVPVEDDKHEIYPLSASGMLKILVDHVWSKLFPAEREKYTEDDVELPDAVRIILEEYFFFWKEKFKNRDFKILLVEELWQREFEGVEFEGRIDYVLELDNGRIVVGDWKSTKSEPPPEYKFMESQLNLYPWGIAPKLKELGVSEEAIEGISVEFDYLSTVLPTKPSQNQDGSLSKRKINTTYLTLTRALKEYGLKWSEEQIDEFLERNSREFFSVKPLPRSKRVIRTILKENVIDAQEIVDLIEDPEKVTRTVSRNCNFDCDFLDLCKGEMYGQNVSYLLKSGYEPRTNTHAGVVEKDDE